MGYTEGDYYTWNGMQFPSFLGGYHIQDDRYAYILILFSKHSAVYPIDLLDRSLSAVLDMEENECIYR